MEPFKTLNAIIAINDENTKTIASSNKSTTSTTSNIIISPINAERMIQNFHLVWLDANIDEVNNEDDRNSINQLEQVMSTVSTFVGADECIDFITDIERSADVPDSFRGTQRVRPTYRCRNSSDKLHLHSLQE